MLVAALSVGYVAWHGHHAVAFAKGDDGDDNGDDDSDKGDDDKGGDKGDDDDTDTSDEDAKTQPPVTAGGLFTLKTYPTNANLRPLTMTQNIAEVKLSVGTDLSAKGAFDSIGLSLEGKYGFTDNVTGLAGFTSAYNSRNYSFYAGIEGSLIYDLLDFRVAANLHRSAITNYAVFCDPPATPGEFLSSDHPTCGNAGAAEDNLPNGKYNAGGTKFSIDIGFPFRYAIKPQIAIVALQTLISVDFNSVAKDFVEVTANPDASTSDPTIPATISTVKGNGAKPDLNPSLGVAINPIPQVSVVLFGQFRVPDFDTAAGAFQVPLTGRVQISPNQKMDFGLEFTLLNVLPPDGQSAIDNRFLSIFFALRAGK